MAPLQRHKSVRPFSTLILKEKANQTSQTTSASLLCFSLQETSDGRQVSTLKSYILSIGLFPGSSQPLGLASDAQEGLETAPDNMPQQPGEEGLNDASSISSQVIGFLRCRFGKSIFLRSRRNVHYINFLHQSSSCIHSLQKDCATYCVQVWKIMRKSSARVGW